jgi:hypothetical protein
MLHLAFRPRTTRLPFYRTLDPVMIPMQLLIALIVPLAVIPWTHPLLLNSAFPTFQVVLALLGLILALSLLVCYLAMARPLHSGTSFPPSLSHAFTWFTVDERFARELYLVGVTGDDIAAGLLAEGRRRWSWLLLIFFGGFAAVHFFAEVALYRLSAEGESAWGLFLPLAWIGLATALTPAAALLELDSRYYAWVKATEYGRYAVLSAIGGLLGAVGMGAIGLHLVSEARTYSSGVLDVLVVETGTPQNIEALLVGIRWYALGSLSLALLLTPLFRYLSARRRKTMEAYFPRLIDRIMERQRA